MPVPSLITDLTTVAATNSPTGSESPATADDYFRAHASFIAQLRESAGGSRCKTINGAFLVNQRNVSGTVALAAGAYGHDRWKAGAGGCTYTFAASSGITTVTISSGSLVQVIEGVNVQSATYTLSWAGTAQGKIGAGPYSASGVSAAVTGGANLSIEFGVGTLGLVQLEVGTVATPFEHRHYGQELALCMRYYQVGATREDFYAQIAFAGVRTSQPFPVVMRGTPTMTKLADTLASNVYSLTVDGGAASTVAFVPLVVSAAAGTVQGAFTWSAEAEL